MKIAVYGRLLHNNNIPYIQELFDLLANKKWDVIVDEQFYAHLVKRIDFKGKIDTFKEHHELADKVDYMFSIGGDGTLLDTVTLIRDSNIPIMGINIGRLGFLASIGKEHIRQAIGDIEKGTYVLDKRSLLKLEASTDIFGEVSYALNEFTIHKKESTAMITLHTYINGDYLNSYWADGLIVATPTGSTAYSLSCGGPIVSPKSKSLVITPVAPHNLNVRPVVVDDDSIISFEIEGRSKQFLATLDSRYKAIDSGQQLAVRKADFTINLVRLNDENFLTTIRNKMMWGMDTRN